MDKVNALGNKVDDLVSSVGDLIGRQKDESKKKHAVLWVLAIVGIVACVAGIAFAVYKFFTPDYLEDFEDDFDDDFDDDYFEDEDVKEE